MKIFLKSSLNEKELNYKTNINKNNPIVTIQNNTNWTNQDVPVTIIGTDK